DPRRKSPLLASVLSLMPGLGQVYVGYYQRGFIHILTVGSLVAILSSAPPTLEPMFPMLGVFLAFFCLYNIIDAGRRASFYNYALAGGRDIELPQDFSLPVHGSIAGGITLIIVGGVLLLNTRFGISLAWLEEWWPLAIIGFGVYLSYRSWSDRKKDAPSGLGDYE
ncbi:MAG: hypothetical protein K8J08_00265, partial [Thermoanaerobaculia bacterium]|nr:hypothetical protein [Thermoanaerobaculia bacterium]